MMDPPDNPPGGTSGKHSSKSRHGSQPRSIMDSLVAGVAAITGMDVEETIGSVDTTVEDVLAHSISNKPGNINNVNLNNIETDIRHLIIKCSSEANIENFRNLDAWATSDELERLGLENVKQCKPIKSGGLLIEVNSLKEVQLSLNIKTFCF